MVTIQKPQDGIEVGHVKSALYGPPGVGKTTFALTAPNPILFDYDEGLKRVRVEDRKDAVTIREWKDVEYVLKELDLSAYDSIVHDTAGKMLDILSIDIIKNAPPKSKLEWNGNLTQQGYGVLKNRFKSFLLEPVLVNKHMVFVAHEKEMGTGDSTFNRPDMAGASMNIMLREMDLVGYITAQNNDRVISFDPSERWYGKNTAGLPAQQNIMSTSMEKCINTYLANQARVNVIAVQYHSLLNDARTKIAGIKDAKDATNIGEEFKKLVHIWDTKLQIQQTFRAKMIELGLKYDQVAKVYIQVQPSQQATQATSTEDEVPMPV